MLNTERTPSMQNNSAFPKVGRGLALRSIVPLVALVACGALLQQRFEDTEWSQVSSAISDISMWTVIAALVLGLLSHLGLAGYDLLAFARIGRRVPWSRALIGGFSGTVVSQVVGFGLITGSYARSRIYRANGVDIAQAVTLTGYVAAGFFSGLCVLLGILTAINPTPAATMTGASEDTIQLAAVCGIGILALGAWMTRRGSVSVALGNMTIRLPDGGWLTGATLLAIFDLVPAALCLAMLLPGQGAPDLIAFIAIYVVAVASGHIVGSPGAVGPFEAIIFLALPDVPVAELAAAVIAYRVTYYLPPFLMALAFIGCARKAPETAILSAKELRNRVDWIMDASGNPEAELAHLGDKHIYLPEAGAAFIMYGISGRTWLMMGDPIGPKEQWIDVFRGFEAEARAAGAKVAIYKAPQQSAPFWQALGYRLYPLGEEAVLDAQRFTTQGSDKRELRRKLNAARKAGTEFNSYHPGEAPLRDLAAVAQAWRTGKSGHEETFSMGHWQAGFTNRHWVFVATAQDTPIAFLSCWVSGDGQEWMIDLMRQMPDVPNGTMHSLIVNAIAAATQAGALRFNLCAAPMSGLECSTPRSLWTRIGQMIYERLGAHHGLTGVRRFKAIFRPDWTQRYMVSRGPLGSIEGLLAARSLIHGDREHGVFETVRSPLLQCPPAPGESVIPAQTEALELDQKRPEIRAA